MKKTFWGFLKWYFVYTSDLQFDDVSFKEAIFNDINSEPRRKARLPLVIISYIVLLGSIGFFILNTQYYKYVVSITGVISSIILLLLCRFSFIYYIVLYNKYLNQDRSLNDKIIYEYSILFDISKDICKIIKKYFTLKNVKGNIFTVKFYLKKKNVKVIDKKRTITVLDEKTTVLKIKSKKIYLNKKVFETTLSDISQLENFLIENS